ncbi:hypothetical protein P3T73_13330 [Kiritimatiellota bacterium B12222]|nr:hypothetical protein P3T73_13330 [Kiritimatiellota bacterium B12222]
MNKKQLLYTYAGTPVDALPEEARALLEKDSALRESFEAQARMASLLKLKTYETPDEAMEGRVLHRVSVRIQNGEHLRREPMLEGLPDWARMVAVVVVMLGLSVFTHREMMDNPIQGSDIHEGIAEREPVELSFERPVYVGNDPFAPMMLPQEAYTDGEYLSPELSSQLEASILELGLETTDFNQSANMLPVSYSLFPRP